MFVKRIVCINRAPFDKLDLSFDDHDFISLTGINGMGKTTILSYITDAFYEMTRAAFPQEYAGDKAMKLYRISTDLYNMTDAKMSMVCIHFIIDNENFFYLDLRGVNNEEAFNTLMSNMDDIVFNYVKYSDVKGKLDNNGHFTKHVTIDTKKAQSVFSKELAVFFPAYRYEQPGYLNDIYKMELQFRKTSEYSGFLINPIEVHTNLPEIANWLLDVILDKELYKTIEPLITINALLSNVLMPKIGKNVRIGIGPRSMGGARIQVIDDKGKTIYPTIFNMSSGETALFCLFGELIRQADKVGKTSRNVEGIVLIDEIDKHMHIGMQMSALPQLIKMFPKVQFIVSTHSAFSNIGVSEELKDRCKIIDLDHGGIECEADSNGVFREAYNVMVKENERYAENVRGLERVIKESNKIIVYLEGRTDEKYFNKALEVFGFTNVDFSFQWIGHMNANGNEEFSGASNMDKAIQFLNGQKTKHLSIFLYDVDTNKKETDNGNIVVMVMPFYEPQNGMNKGIENALDLSTLKMEDFYNIRTEEKDYGQETVIKEFKKMKLCDFICELQQNDLQKILANLKPVIERIVERVKRYAEDE